MWFRRNFYEPRHVVSTNLATWNIVISHVITWLITIQRTPSRDFISFSSSSLMVKTSRWIKHTSIQFVLGAVCFPENKIEAEINEGEKESCNHVQCVRFPLYRVSFEIVRHFVPVNFDEFQLLLLSKRIMNYTSRVVHFADQWSRI